MRNGFVLAAALWCPLLAALTASAQTAVCDGKFHWLDVAGTECLDGSQTGIEYLCQAGATGPLVVDLVAGGACWDGVGCQCDPDEHGNCTNPNTTIAADFWGKADSDDGLTWDQSYWGGAPLNGTTAAVFAGPSSPFNRNWNIVEIPYCTGDVHSGDAVQNYPNGSGMLTAHHRGYRNITRDLPVIKSLFPSPSRVALWGQSAGAYGIACNLGQFVNAWPGIGMASFQNAFAPWDSTATPLVPTVARNWGAWRPGKDGGIEVLTCPIEVPAGTPNAWSELAVVNYEHLHFPGVRKAWSDDYSDAVFDEFACLLGAPQDANGSCAAAVAAALNRGQGLIGDDPSYRVYFHTGLCEAQREGDGNSPLVNGFDPSCDYDNMVQPPAKAVQPCQPSKKGVCFRDWVQQWIGNSPAWGNVR
jgi:hypothetical protein